MNKLAEQIIRLKWLIIFTVITLTAFFGYQLKDIKINSDIISTLPDDDPIALLYKEVGKQYGGNSMGMIAFETDNIFNKEVLAQIKQITDTLLISDGVSTVTSLTNVLDIKGGKWGIEIGNLIDEYDLPDTRAELDSLKKYIYSKDMYVGSIISEDATTTMIMFTLFEDVDNQEVARQIKKNILGLNLPVKLYFGGMPFMMNDVSDLIIDDIIKLLPLTFLLILIVLFFSFRTIRGVVLPLLSAGISVIWTMGLMSFLNYELSMISDIIPIILLAIGSAYTIHVLNKINQALLEDRKKALIKALEYIIIPVTLAALTTVIGFVSFVFGAYLTMIRDFGIFTAIGVFFAFILAIFFVPAVISVFSMYKSKKRIAQNGKKKHTFLNDYILSPLKNLLIKHPKRILTTWIAVMLLSFTGIFNINRSVSMMSYFKENNPTRVAENIIQNKFGGSQPVFVVVRGDIQSPEVLKMMIKTENYMKASPDIERTQSVADLVEEMNDVMGEGKKIPDDRAKVENLWFLLDGQDIMAQLVTDDLDQALIQSRFISDDIQEMSAFKESMNKFIKENSTENIKIELTGMPSVYSAMDESLINSQISSLLISILLVLIIVGLILRSPVKGIYAAVPIIATVTFLFGFMGLTGIPLDVATVLVGSIALGIGIDYSIHIITHFSYAYKESNNLHKAMAETIMVSGKAIVINVLSVASGFLVLIFSQMVPLQNFGILVAISMIGSGLGALTLLPVLLILHYRRKERLAIKN